MDSRLRGNDGVMKIQSFYESITINFTYCLEYHLQPSLIQIFNSLHIANMAAGNKEIRYGLSISPGVVSPGHLLRN